MTQSLVQAKAARDAAHAAFQARFTQIQADLAARGIGGRIVDRAGEAMADAAEVASENKGVIAGTVAAMAVWFMRGPIIRWIAGLWDDD